MKKRFPTFCRVPVDFGNQPVRLVAIQRRRAQQSRAREQAVQSPDRKEVGLHLEQSLNCRENGSLTVGSQLRIRPSRFNDSPRKLSGFNAKPEGFTLVEVLVTLVLLSMIVLALMAVFSGIQRAFRASLTQTDTLEGGRAVMDLIANDLETMTPANWQTNISPINNSPSPNYYAPVNFFVAEQSFVVPSPPTPLFQPLLSSPTSQMRTNILENIFILSKGNISGVPSWIGTGYSVTTNLADGTLYPLYRFYMATNAAAGPAGEAGLFAQYHAFQYTNTGEWSHLMDGVVNLTARAYDTNGVWMTNGYVNPQAFHVRFVSFIPQTNGITECFFYSNAIPASVQIELGTLEDHTLRHAESLSGPNQNSYLSNAGSQVHVFRQRIWIRNMDPTAYE
ncbi:MAG TPA: prepilin-type N-terminal cleavage/methylation domain-containing protein [Verrucomicrobiae bacterium]|jgi:prepilin-type N-terminal cleavage/methylation domain-containing protein|nr:prepilin-type N-terminal cleavage/methylation domain-containing protein [Verrucomicrobiae bacterium]